jgi:hypothetical protein
MPPPGRESIANAEPAAFKHGHGLAMYGYLILEE